VSVYNRALGRQKFQAIYNAGAPGKCTHCTRTSIVRQPQAQASQVGERRWFFVDALGQSFAFSMQLHSNNLAGATNYSLEITNVQITNAGSTTVVVTNAYGSITSAQPVDASLTASIVTQPLSQTNMPVKMSSSP